MYRYAVGALAALLLGSAGLFLFGGRASTEIAPLPPAPLAPSQAVVAEPLPAEAPRASERTREQKRFDRYDKDRDEAITRDEYLATRRKAFAKLDANGDGRLTFDEWAVRTTAKFAAADGDRSGSLTRAEFAKTATKRKAAKPRCACPPPGSDDGD